MALLRALLAAALACSGAALSDPVLTQIQSRIAASQVYDAGVIAMKDAELALNLSYIIPSNYTFSDIGSYNVTTPAWFPAFFHCRRIMWFTSMWASPASSYYHSASLLNTTLALLDTWLANDFGCGPGQVNAGWWYCQVGVPDSLGRALAILEPLGLLSPAQTAGCITLMNRAKAAYGCTDANCVWLSTNMFYKGIFTGNTTLVNSSLATVWNTIQVWPGTAGGQKEDNSFWMHGNLLYSGGYGMSFVNGIAELLAWTRDTAYYLPNTTALATFSALVLDGSARMMHWGRGMPPYGPTLWDIAPVGRDIARPYGADWFTQAGQAVIFAPATIAGVGGPRADELVQLSALLAGNWSALTPPAIAALAGTAVFWVSDYITHKGVAPSGPDAAPTTPTIFPAATPLWTVGHKVTSSRTLRSEFGNLENAKGWHLSEGATWTYVHGYEYVDLQPALDWRRLPGTTVRAYGYTYSGGDVGGYGATTFAGGVQDPGTAGGASALDFVAPQAGVGLSYRKSVAFFPSFYVSLTCNITLDPAKVGAGTPAWTTLEQKRAAAYPGYKGGSTSDLYTSDSPSTPLAPGNYTLAPTVWWVWEGGVGYVLLDRLPAGPTRSGSSGSSSIRGTSASTSAAVAGAAILPTLHVSLANQTGDWSSIGAEFGPVSAPVFTLWLEHVWPVAGAAVAYAVAPAPSLETWVNGGAAAVAASISVLSNTPEVQAVGVVSAPAPMNFFSAASIVAYTSAGSGGLLPSVGADGVQLGVNSAGAFFVALNSTDGVTYADFSVANPSQAGGFKPTITAQGLNIVGSGPDPDGNTCLTKGSGAGPGATLPAAANDGRSTTASCKLLGA